MERLEKGENLSFELKAVTELGLMNLNFKADSTGNKKWKRLLPMICMHSIMGNTNNWLKGHSVWQNLWKNWSFSRRAEAFWKR
ncbi:hypothetical protein PN4B1_18730 [Paenibacillus naphthalenovorans]|nr:hypothetical protein PN4B1_18730 [Paenibacillus naphthalenovorans]